MRPLKNQRHRHQLRMFASNYPSILACLLETENSWAQLGGALSSSMRIAFIVKKKAHFGQCERQGVALDSLL